MLLSLILIFALGVLGWAMMEQRKNILQTVSELKECSTFLDCAEKAGLTGVLEKDGPFTVFIPTNEAFEKIPKQELNNFLNNKSALTALLLYHMVPRKLTPAELESLEDCMTCTVPQTSITCSREKYGKGKCVRSDIVCTNGTVYVIDTVQFPPFLKSPLPSEPEGLTITETITEAVVTPESKELPKIEGNGKGHEASRTDGAGNKSEKTTSRTENSDSTKSVTEPASQESDEDTWKAESGNSSTGSSDSSKPETTDKTDTSMTPASSAAEQTKTSSPTETVAEGGDSESGEKSSVSDPSATEKEEPSMKK